MYSSVQSRTQAEEDVAFAVDRDGFMESFFRKVGVTVASRFRDQVAQDSDVSLVDLGGRSSRTH